MRKVLPINKKLFFFGISLIVLAWLSLDDLVDDWGQIEGAPEKLNEFFSESLLPPDWSVLEAEVWADGSLHKPNCEVFNQNIELFWCKELSVMVITIKMPFIATLIGFFFSIPIASLAANNMAPLPIAMPARVILAGLRSLPSIIWA